MMLENKRVGIVGLGYVGLPLALAFGEKIETLGFDIDKTRIDNLVHQIDQNGETHSQKFLKAKYLNFTSDRNKLNSVDIFIITVPTPVDSFNCPDFSAIVEACKIVAKHMRPGCYVIFESTVYPGATEELCIPILEEKTGLRVNESFFVGYSPERINPGDADSDISQIPKLIGGSSEAAAKNIFELYALIIRANLHITSSIKVAEAAKVIENVQRDVNVGLMNELAVLFSKLNIPMNEILEAASTKWNFLPFTPGLVGGHCISVDPYYLLHKAKSINFHPELIQAARRVNDSVVTYITNRVINQVLIRKSSKDQIDVLVLGLSFKENCSDTRNSRALEIVRDLVQSNINVSAWDPVFETMEKIEGDLCSYFNLTKPSGQKFDAVVIAVAHDQIRNFGLSHINDLLKNDGFILDIKNIFQKSSNCLQI